MTDTAKHPLLGAIYEASLAVEQLGASLELTAAGQKVSNLTPLAEALVDENIALKADRERLLEMVDMGQRVAKIAKMPPLERLAPLEHGNVMELPDSIGHWRELVRKPDVDPKLAASPD